jgi:SAM-dependent methyltransferase
MTPLEAAYYEGAVAYIQKLTRESREKIEIALLSNHQVVADYEASLSGATDAQIRLNLGSSDATLSGFTNVDILPGPGILVADLMKSWPWADDSVDYVRASHVIEHLPDKIFTMNELWRVLRPGSRADIAVPTTDGPGAFQDPTHVSFWNRRSFLYYEHGSPYRESNAKGYGIQASFRVVRERTDDTFDGPVLAITLEAVKA